MNRPDRWALTGLLVLLCTLPAPKLFADQVLLQLGKVDPATIRATDATVRLAQDKLQVQTAHHQPWPGITIPAPGKSWDLSAFEYILVDVKNLGDSPLTLYCRVDNPGADGVKNCNTASITLQKGQASSLKVPFSRMASGGVATKLFGMRGYPAGFDPKGTLDPSNITQLLLFVSKPQTDHAFEVGQISAGGHFASPRIPETAFFPFIDEFGQYIHNDWPGKVHSLAELKQHALDEAQELAQKTGPADWDQYGGWNAGPSLQATGFFRTTKHNGKWWLVDPLGKLFWSNGIDCVRMLDVTPIDERATWFKNFPGDQPEFKEFLTGPRFALHGHYAGKQPKTFAFAAANLQQKYGQPWRQTSAQIAHTRLRSWGINTIGNWSDSSVYLMRKTPYVCTVSSGRIMIEGSEGYWGKFPDVFDPAFAAETRQRMKQASSKTAGDPCCIGYFVDNEMSWGDEVSLALGTLKSPASQAAKKVFLQDLQTKYLTIDKLNQAWATNYPSWQQMLESRQTPDRQKARADLVAFYTKAAEQYFRVVKESLRAVAPHQLYLGCRFAWVNPQAVAAAVKYCDVVSFNLYQRSIADFKLPGNADVPLIVGEFHFGALDRGMFHTGLVPTDTQSARAQAYKDYVRGALRHPQFVGVHWFQYQDEPTTGRVYDEENYQIGFIDGVDTPYRETIDASREIGYRLYPERLDQ
ncbi:MAG TPA: beta-galactosidase [Tepidisphaeraceae bacterium]|nr:beta-galactosidase [Tepidisphaeraceae bacterium]